MKARKLFKWVVILLPYLILFVYMLYPTTNLVFSGGSFYLSDAGVISCEGEWDCRHEVGHLMDKDLGYPSKSKAFGKSLLVYTVYKLRYEEMDDITKTILGNPGSLVYSESFEAYSFESGSSPQQELYANIYADVNGNIEKIPPILRRYYSESSKYDEVYEELVDEKLYFSNEGANTVKEKLLALVAKMKENKQVLIKAGLILTGAVVGGVIAAAIARAQETEEFTEEELLGLESDEEAEDLEDEEE